MTIECFQYVSFFLCFGFWCPVAYRAVQTMEFSNEDTLRGFVGQGMLGSVSEHWVVVVLGFLGEGN